MTFEGNEAYSSRDLLDILPFGPGVFLNDSLIGVGVSRLLGFYQEGGYYGAEVIPVRTTIAEEEGRAGVLFRIREGMISTVHDIVFTGNRVLSSSQLRDLMSIRAGDVLEAASLEEDIGMILDEYESVGYPLASVSIGAITPARDGSSAEMSITIEVREGEPVNIVEMRVEGNSETLSDVILRESRITPPERFDPGKISRFRDRLQRMGIFSTVEEPVLYSTERGGGLLLRVAEGRTSTFDGVIGYAPERSAPDGEGSFSGMARISMRNLFGTARRFEARWSRDPGSTQEIRLFYDEPWLFGFPLDVGGWFYQRRQDTTFVERKVGGTATFLATTSLSISLVAEGTHIIPSESSGPSAPASSSSFGGGLAVRLDTRDDRYSPRRGALYESEYRVGVKRLSAVISPGMEARETVRNLSLDLDTYFGLFRNQVVNAGFHARQLWSPRPEASDLYRLGGFQALRGFRENRFMGSRLAWTVMEYRLLSGQRSFFYGFFDGGYIYSPLTDPPDLFTFGYGLGMRIETGIGLVAVSFALGKGDPVSETKIHFGLVNDF